MMKLRSLISNTLALALGIVFFCAMPVHAQEDVAITVARGLAHIELAFVPVKDATIEGHHYSSGTPDKSQATGFLVSVDGYLLTSYHLLAPVVATDGTDIVLTIHMKGPNGEEYSGAIVDTRKQLDLALLKIRPKLDVPLQPLSLARANVATGTEVFTSGFFGVQPFNKLATRILDQDGPVGTGYLWTLQGRFAPGQSGSPVYTADGDVIGIIKGEDTQAAVGYMVPIDFAGSLISHLRMRSVEQEVAGLQDQVKQLNKELQDVNEQAKGYKPIGPRLATVEDDLKGVNSSLTDLSNGLTWSVKNNKISESNHTIIISYKKPFSDRGPKINRLQISATPIYFKRGNESAEIQDADPMIDEVFFDTVLQDHGGKVEIKRENFPLEAFFALRTRVDVIVKVKLSVKYYSDEMDLGKEEFEPLTVDFKRSVTN
jgi:S1-C subfamily serine protease